MDIIRSVERSFKVLEELSNYSKGLGITELCDLTNLSKSTISRILNTLINIGYVDQDSTTSKYISTFKLLEIGNKKIAEMDIASIVHPYLKQISEITNETIHLVIRDGIYGVYIDKIKPNKSITMDTKIGMRKPLYCTAYGKIMLSDFPTDKVQEIWTKSEIKKYTDYTITDYSNFLKEQDKIKKNGYAIDNQEVELNVGCISVPLRDYSQKIIAAISLSYIVSHTTKEKIPEYISILKNFSEIISKELGAK